MWSLSLTPLLFCTSRLSMPLLTDLVLPLAAYVYYTNAIALADIRSHSVLFIYTFDRAHTFSRSWVELF